MFFKGSRYENVETATMTDVRGREIRYKKMRRIPDAPARQTHRVRQGERLDQIAHRYYGDPERFWKICDANFAMWPGELVADPEQKLRIPGQED